jgi:SagB-type dehydrogenase family enzyme
MAPIPDKTRSPLLSSRLVVVQASHPVIASQALFAWKAVGRNRWSLRVNPSGGNLHPTEAYLVAGPIAGWNDAPAVYHYAPVDHALEQRAELSSETWHELASSLPSGSVFVALCSVLWREAWKYGERCFRYCQHDVGHAMGALSIAAAMQGRRCRLVESIRDVDLSELVGIADQSGPEREHPDLMLAITPDAPGWVPKKESSFRLSEGTLDGIVFSGMPNRLSPNHQPWPILTEVAAASERNEGAVYPTAQCEQPLDRGNDRGQRARTLVRTRRSAMDMDGKTRLDRGSFYRMMERVVPASFVASALPWPPQVHLILFVHRVDDLEPGLYALIRNANHEESLREALDRGFAWTVPDGCPDHMKLRLLRPSDVRDVSRTVSCHQDIASDGAFSAGMLARFRPALEQFGPWFYRRLFWETGLIGQVLYLEAEAAGIRGTGIGCFFDDLMHEILGIHDRSFQSLYHFTVGGAVDDPRLRTLPAYAHLSRNALENSR